MRRNVAFCVVAPGGRVVVKGVEILLEKEVEEVHFAWKSKGIPVLGYPECQTGIEIRPHVIVDGILTIAGGVSEGTLNLRVES